MVKTLHVSVRSVHNLHQANFLDAECSRGGKPRKFTSAHEQTYVLEMVWERVDIGADVARSAQEVMQVSG